MLVLLVSSASAYSDVCDGGNSIIDLAGLALRQDEPATITLTDDCDTEDTSTPYTPYIDLQVAGSYTTELTLVSDTSIDPFGLPPIRVGPGFTLHLQRVRVDTVQTWDFTGAVADSLGPAFDVGILVQGGTLDIAGLEMAGSTGIGILAVDAIVEGEGLDAAGFDEYRPLFSIAEGTSASVTLANSTFIGNGAGAVGLWGASATIEARFTDALFQDNGPVGAADIGAIDATLTVTDTTFEGSSAIEDTTVGGAPVYLDGGDITCTNCTFDATSGTKASTIAASLGSGDAVVLSGGLYAPATAEDAVMYIDSGGSFQTNLVTFSGAGELFRGGGSTVIGAGTHFEASGQTPARYAIFLSSTYAVLDGVTICDYASNGWGLIGATGSNLTMSDSVIQNLSYSGDRIINARPDMGGSDLTIVDNTMVGSEGVFVGGTPASLEFTNNLIASSTGGLDLEATPGGAEVGYNLWFEVDTPVAGGTTEATDVVDQDPLLIDAFDVGTCGSGPWLEAGSPANGAGTPDRPDGYGNYPSDIGAVDSDDEPDADTDADSDSDSDADTDADTDTRDSGTLDDTLPPGLVGGALQPCGCGGSGAAFPLLLLTPLLARRRGRSA